MEENAPTPCVRYGELYTKFGAVITETYSRTNIDPNNLRFSKGGEILVPRVGEKPEDFGKCCCYLTLQNIAIGEMISVFETAQNPLFYTYYFRYLYKEFAKVVEGQNVKNLYYVELEPLPICRPTSPEQQKIADCLSSIDDLITAETQKLAALKEHKKGLMQQLFPAEGETVPKLRFPEFRDAGEWEEKTLGSFCKVGDIDHKMPSSVTCGIPYVMTGDFFGINSIDFDNAKKISAEDYEQLSRKIKPEFGDIIIARYASVGAVRYIETKIKFLVSYSCAIIKCNKPESSKYLYYIFQSDAIQSKIGLEINMSSQKNIGIDSIKKLNIFLPTLPEQQKITDCLSSVDELIAAQAQKIEALKQHKKGLMQQLFPSMDEGDK